MNGESRPLVTDEPVEFEDKLVELPDFRKKKLPGVLEESME